MDDTISRRAAIDCVTYDVEHTIECLKALSPAQPEHTKGHWIVWGGMDIPENHGKHKCSLCGEFAPVRYEKPLIKEYLSDFCPNCGADMRKEGAE